MISLLLGFCIHWLIANSLLHWFIGSVVLVFVETLWFNGSFFLESLIHVFFAEPWIQCFMHSWIDWRTFRGLIASLMHRVMWLFIGWLIDFEGFIDSLVDCFIESVIHVLIYASFHWLNHSPILWFIHPFLHSFPSFIHSSPPSFISSLSSSHSGVHDLRYVSSLASQQPLFAHSVIHFTTSTCQNIASASQKLSIDHWCP